ncbi:MAG: HD-GYP domain-containing protein [Planctomycetota bacterium]|jgi:HD-GYP domain-containing protein (c-di-GMP phosphodiesterase class II)
MRAEGLFEEDFDGHGKFRIAIVLTLVLIVTTGQKWIPNNNAFLHTLHLILGKFYLIPIVLGAIWFGFGGAILSAAWVTLFYLLQAALQWAEQIPANIDQFGELATIWIVAVLAGVLTHEEKRALQEADEIYQGSLIALVAALDAREHDTQLHSLRVRAYAMRVGRELDLDRYQLHILEQASLLHDVGKIGTPDRILLKPGPLDDEEWDIMQQHPQTGRRLLMSVPFLKDAAEIVYCHHEKYDGSGYPSGLIGDRIPLLARIFAVIDVFDALTSDRPYRKKLNYEDAREIVHSQSGKHFDPEITDAFLRISHAEWIVLESRVSQCMAWVTSSAAKPSNKCAYFSFYGTLSAYKTFNYKRQDGPVSHLISNEALEKCKEL